MNKGDEGLVRAALTFEELESLSTLPGEEIDALPDEVLVQYDPRTYAKRIEHRVRDKRCELLQAHNVPTELFDTLRYLSDAARRQQIEELLVQVDVKALERAYLEIWDKEMEKVLRTCDQCRAVLAPNTAVQWGRYSLVCQSCEAGRLTQPSRPPINGLRSALARARRAHLPATLMEAEWQRTIAHFHDRCAYCGGPWAIVEHATPIELGGATTAANCLPACTSCNMLKGKRTLEAVGPLFTLTADAPAQLHPDRLAAATAWLRQCGRISCPAS